MRAKSYTIRVHPTRLFTFLMVPAFFFFFLLLEVEGGGGHVTSSKLLSYAESSFSKRPYVVCLTCFDLNLLFCGLIC